MAHQEIEAQMKTLVKTIREYESDTFSATATKLKKREAEQIAAALASRAIQELIDGETLDGITLSEELEMINE